MEITETKFSVAIGGKSSGIARVIGTIETTDTSCNAPVGGKSSIIVLVIGPGGGMELTDSNERLAFGGKSSTTERCKGKTRIKESNEKIGLIPSI